MHSIATVECELDYVNDTNQVMEAIFYFSISADSCFDNFEAIIGTKVFKGIIKEKEEAKEEYIKKKEQGKTVAYAEIDSELKDTIEVINNFDNMKESIINIYFFK